VAQQRPVITFEDLPLEEARRMSRGPRMDAALDQALRDKIQSLGDTATRLALSEGTPPRAMKNRILRLARALGVPVTIRKVPGGLLFWRSTAEDRRQAQETVQRLQRVQRRRGSRPGRRRA
jgi:hypothetical protein